jgi:hypothetical protein
VAVVEYLLLVCESGVHVRFNLEGAEDCLIGVDEGVGVVLDEEGDEEEEEVYDDREHGLI